MHTDGRRFDAEDLRIMTNLGTFASAAYQTLLSLNETQRIASIVETSEDAIIGQDIKPINKIKALAELLGQECLPNYLINYIESFCPLGDRSLAVHLPKSIAGYSDKDGEMDKATITRTKGFIGKNQMEVTRYPEAIHHINIFFNDLGKARIFYKYDGSIRFLKTEKKA